MHRSVCVHVHTSGRVQKCTILSTGCDLIVIYVLVCTVNSRYLVSCQRSNHFLWEKSSWNINVNSWTRLRGKSGCVQLRTIFLYVQCCPQRPRSLIRRGTSRKDPGTTQQSVLPRRLWYTTVFPTQHPLPSNISSSLTNLSLDVCPQFTSNVNLLVVCSTVLFCALYDSYLNRVLFNHGNCWTHVVSPFRTRGHAGSLALVHYSPLLFAQSRCNCPVSSANAIQSTSLGSTVKPWLHTCSGLYL